MVEEPQNVQEEQLSEEELSQRNDSIFQQRKSRVIAMIEEGKKPYGSAYAGAQSIESVRGLYREDEEIAVNIAGRIMSFRDMGKSIFAHVRDASGDLQIYAQKNVLGDEAYAPFKKLDIGDIIGIQGVLFVTHKGELTLKVHAYTLLSKILRPLPEKWHGLTDQEQRYRQRYVDLIVNPGAANMLKMRSRIVQELRNYLTEQGYYEVETPIMQPMAGGAAATPFETYYNALTTKMYLRIATELYLKKLIVGGFEKVYEIGRIFRNEGLDKRHNPEFTTMELYQAYGDCRSMMDLVENFVTHIAQKLFGTLKIEHANGRTINLERPWRRANYDDLIREKMGADFFELPLDAMIAKAKALDLDTDDMKSVDDVTKEVYEKTIEPTLIDPCFVTRLPKDFVPLAKACDDDPRYVDVFELACNGYELCPGYSELNDPIEQYKRFAAQAAAAGNNPDDVIDADFICALEYGMPPTGGIGIGIDRLCMMLTGAESIRDVLLFPQMKPRK